MFEENVFFVSTSIVYRVSNIYSTVNVNVFLFDVSVACVQILYTIVQTKLCIFEGGSILKFP